MKYNSHATTGIIRARGVSFHQTSNPQNDAYKIAAEQFARAVNIRAALNLAACNPQKRILSGN